MSRDLCVCGHLLVDHERVSHDHSWVCWAKNADGADSCACAGCQEPGSEARCACRSFRAVAAGPKREAS